MNPRKRAAARERRLARRFNDETDTAVSPSPSPVAGVLCGFVRFPFSFLDVWGGEPALDEFRPPPR